MLQLSDYEIKSLRKLEESIRNDQWSQSGLVKLIKLVGEGYLNMMTIPNYAKSVKKSYPGVLKTKKPEVLFDVKFIIDND
jgi:hypothetical protein